MAPIFISHQWRQSAFYSELVALLNATGLAWHNLSISETDAVEIEAGEPARQQIANLIADRLLAVANWNAEVGSELKRTKRRLSTSQQLISDLKNFSRIDELETALRERILDPDFVQALRHLARLRKQYAGCATELELRRARADEAFLAEEITRLEIKAEWLREEAKKYERMLTHGLHHEKTGKARDSLFRDHPNLALAISNRVAAADVVLVLADFDSPFRRWIEFEYQESFVLRKPILAVLHPRLTNHVPPDLRYFGVEEVEWRAFALAQAIRRHAR
jgi:hypothetical protein